MPPSRRWLVAICGTLLQLCLGTVYAWSFFQKPLVSAYGWSNTQVMGAFSLAIFCLGLAAAVGGMNLGRFGPRKLAVLGGAMFGAGYLIGAGALYWRQLPLLYLGYGCVGGLGLGLGYVTPVATVAKWFPDKKGLVTGMVIMGFGFGALLMSKVLAPALVEWSRPAAGQAPSFVLVFAWLGGLFLLVTPAVAWALHNPPEGYSPPGYFPVGATCKVTLPPPPALSPRQCLLSGRFAVMWLVFFCNIAAGIAIISLQSPLIQDLWKKLDPSLGETVLAGYGATLIAVSSLFNGAGRFFWGALSDRIGPANTFRIMLGTQILAFAALTVAANPWLFAALICYVLLCYGGGFGTMPAFVIASFGQRVMAVVYGAILTAWSVAGVVGPQLMAWIKDRFGEHAAGYSFGAGLAFLAAGMIGAVFFLRSPRTT